MCVTFQIPTVSVAFNVLEHVFLYVMKADQRVLRQLIVSYLPKLDESLKEHDIGKVNFTKVK